MSDYEDMDLDEEELIDAFADPDEMTPEDVMKMVLIDEENLPPRDLPKGAHA